MAGESKIAVPDGGTKNVHTWQRVISATNVEEDVAIIGEPYLASYTVVPTAGISCATAGDDIAQLMAGASLNLRVRRIRVEQAALTTTANGVPFTVARVTTAGTGGTALTPSKKDNGDPAAGATAASGVPNATHGAIGAVFLLREIFPVQTAGAAGNPIAYWEWVQAPNTKPFIIPAGVTNGIVIRNATARAGLTVNFEIEFDESSFL